MAGVDAKGVPNSRKNSPALVAILLVVFAAVAMVIPAIAAANPLNVAAYGSLVDLRPDRPAPAGGSTGVAVSVARNESRSFQLLVQAGPGGDAGVRVAAAGALQGPGGATLPASALTIYREGYYNVTQRSNGEGDTGLWPDALIPARDSFYGEERNAFPVNLGSGAQLAAWIDVLVPQSQPAGTYTGQVAVTDAGGTVANVPLSVTVRNFTLASTSTLQNAFFVQTGKICQAFTGNPNCQSAEQAWAFDALFAEAGLNNRVTLANAYAAEPNSPYFDRFFAPLVEGTDSRVQLPGAKLTSVEVYGPSCSNCLGAWKTAAEAHGFANRFFLYACDEPETTVAWEQCKRNVESGRRSWEDVRTLVTAPMQQSAASYIDIFNPLINEVGSGARSTSYASFLSQPKKEFWLYTSCRSFSCDSASEGSEFERWPGYAIDSPPSQNVAMGWLSFLYGATGELYWSTTASLTTATTQQYTSGGNGDGNLFYAGTPGGGNGSIAIGGSNPIPIESIRLKRIRDAREDYEYFTVLKEAGLGESAMQVIRNVFGSEAVASHNATVAATAIEAGRQVAAEMIETKNPGIVQAEPTHEEPAPAPAPESPPAQPETAPVEAPATVPVSAPLPSRSKRSAPKVTVAAESAPAGAQLEVLKVSKPRSARELGRRGVKMLVTCKATCRARVSAEVSAATAGALHMHSVRLASGNVTLAAKQQVWLKLRVAGSQKRILIGANTAAVAVQTSYTMQ